MRCRPSDLPTSCKISAACSPKIESKRRLCLLHLHTRALQLVSLAPNVTRPYNARQRAQHKQATMFHPCKIRGAYCPPLLPPRLLDATLPNMAAMCRPYRMPAAFLVDDSLTILHTHCVIPRPLRPLCICIACLMLSMFLFFSLPRTQIVYMDRLRWIYD
jgi:hypothetical protein